ncbi:MAG: ribulose-phosphate 3-epimerase [Chitinivibrionales bacterium]|nr:ribulose-phosphate 3-epimerase [Chitinivibrionales bacterium]
MLGNSIQVCPSILSADFRRLEDEVKRVEDAGADRIHCDVMDGHFVPNLTFGPMVVETVKKCVNIPLDVHLMISNPADYIANYSDAGADVLSFHAEAVDDPAALLDEIRSCNVKSAIAVNPDKPVELFMPFLDRIDQVLIMTVFAGFGGQKFIADTTAKMKAVAEAAKKLAHSVEIQVDGGINAETPEVCAANGATVFVAGSYVFGGENYRERIANVRAAAQRGLQKSSQVS